MLASTVNTLKSLLNPTPLQGKFNFTVEMVLLKYQSLLKMISIPQITIHRMKYVLIFTAILVRYGHQMCTRNTAGRPIAKRRGIKRNHNAQVLAGQLLVTQRVLKFHPGMNVRKI